jgi:hypothetical protein
MAAAKNILMVFTSHDKLGEHDEQVLVILNRFGSGHITREANSS